MYTGLRRRTTNCIIDPSLVESQETRPVTAARNDHFGSWLQQLTDSMDGLLPSVQDKEGRYLLTPWIRVLLEKLTGFQLVKNIPAF